MGKRKHGETNTVGLKTRHYPNEEQVTQNMKKFCALQELCKEKLDQLYIVEQLSAAELQDMVLSLRKR